MEGNIMDNDDKKKYLKRLKVHNTILIVIMIIAAAILIYRVSDYVQGIYCDHCSESLDTLSGLEVSFNRSFEVYGGQQTGSQVKALIQKLIANARTYQEEASKIPKVEYRSSDGEIIYSDNRIESVAYEEPSEEKSSKYDFYESERRMKWKEEARKQDQMISTEFLENDGYNSYVKELSGISDKLRNKHTYEVEFKYKWDQIVSTVIINEL